MDRGDKRAQILDAALAVFSRKGVFATRIADIATEAEVAYGLVYHYFRNKEEILNTIFEERWARVTEVLQDAAKGGRDARERLKRAAGVFIDAYRERPQVVEVLLLEFARMSKFLEPVHIEHIARAFAVVERIIEQGQADGELRKDVAAPVLMLLFIGGIQLILQTQMLGTFQPPRDFQERGEQIVADLFLDGAAQR